ncbi:hypothetical protein HBH89_227240 [Parastagonospora nodorum]|nr:hypothetical protein HBH89_227240 [Parastagonospora nodorum]
MLGISYASGQSESSGDDDEANFYGGEEDDEQDQWDEEMPEHGDGHPDNYMGEKFFGRIVETAMEIDRLFEHDIGMK